MSILASTLHRETRSGSVLSLSGRVGAVAGRGAAAVLVAGRDLGLGCALLFR